MSNDRYEEIKEDVIEEAKTVIWLLNKISINEKNGNITSQQKEELLNMLYSR